MVHKTMIYGLVCFTSLVVPKKIMTWDDNPDLEKEDNFIYMVVLVGENVDLVCQVEQAAIKGDIKWSKDGKHVENQDKPTVTKVNGNWMMKSHFKLDNVTLDLDGVPVVCNYEEKVLIEGFGSINYWPLEAVLAVFSASGDNISRYGVAVRERMEAKIANIKNIVAANQYLVMDDNDAVARADIDDNTQAVSKCSSGCTIVGCIWVLIPVLFIIILV